MSETSEGVEEELELDDGAPLWCPNCESESEVGDLHRSSVHGDLACPTCDRSLRLMYVRYEDLRSRLEEAREERDEWRSKAGQTSSDLLRVMQGEKAARRRSEKLEEAVRRIASWEDGGVVMQSVRRVARREEAVFCVEGEVVGPVSDVENPESDG